MNKGPIGIFDSGVGGTSIWREINQLLPEENTIYLADSKNAPYGDKSPQAILDLSVKNTEFLIQQGCKIIVVACNTATTNAIDHLRSSYELPFIGIEPAIKPAAIKSESGTIGVLATKGTLASHLFSQTSKNYAANINVIEREGKDLVRLIEAGAINDTATEVLLRQYLKPMIEAGMDHLVLGCTHYPYLIPILKKLLPEHVNIIDCGAAVARQTLNILEVNELTNTSGKKASHSFYTNGDPEILHYFTKDIRVAIKTDFLDF